MHEPPLSPEDRLWLWAARLGPAGLMPAPGTAGSLAALVAAPWLFLPLSTPLRLVLLALVFAAGAAAAGRAERILGRTDPGQVVIDELLGQWIALLPLAQGSGGRDSLGPMILAFVLFRVLDIRKPWPVRRCETLLPGGWGIMLDDVAAGLLAALGLALVQWAGLA